MTILAIDTAASLCAACVLDAETSEERGRAVLDIGKGHAEHLIGVIEGALARASLSYPHIGMIAVSVGPGSFTGVRVGVSAARGLALALGLPAVGVGTLEAIAEEARPRNPCRPILAVVEAGRGGIYMAGHDAAGHETIAPCLTTAQEAGEAAARDGAVLAGSAAQAVAAAAGVALDIATRCATADIATYGRIAIRRGLPGLPARPLYLRGADARPQTGFALARTDAP